MKFKGHIRYPRWVNPSRLTLGDVKYMRDHSRQEWVKYIYTGMEWRAEANCPAHLVKKSGLRQSAHGQITLQRTEGIK